MSTTLELTPLKFQNALWEGIVTQTGTGVPQVQVLLRDRPVPGIKLSEGSNKSEWNLSFTVPPEVLNEGVHTFLIVDTLENEKIGNLTILAGDVLADDMRMEMELLRAELDMLKRAFRRHCVETI